MHSFICHRAHRKTSLKEKSVFAVEVTMVVIRAVETRLIFDSCGNPTVEVGILFDDGTFARVSLPIEDSTGVYSDYLGEDVLEVVNSIIRPALIGKDLTDLIMCLMVRELNVIAFEGGWCKEKRKLGFKAVWAIVLAVCKAKAVVQNKFLLNEHIAKKTLELPVAAFNVINGGSHAGHKLTMQECMSLLVGASSFTEAGKMGVECEEKAIKEDYNALLMKVNQISSVVESIEAKLAGHGVMASHQSGETEDTLYTGQLKSGAPCRSDRLAKYNQLLMIVESFANFICDLAKLLRVHLARSNQEE